jgi:hypothetical protein
MTLHSHTTRSVMDVAKALSEYADNIPTERARDDRKASEWQARINANSAAYSKGQRA